MKNESRSLDGDSQSSANPDTKTGSMDARRTALMEIGAVVIAGGLVAGLPLQAAAQNVGNNTNSVTTTQVSSVPALSPLGLGGVAILAAAVAARRLRS